MENDHFTWNVLSVLEFVTECSSGAFPKHSVSVFPLSSWVFTATEVIVVYVGEERWEVLIFGAGGCKQEPTDVFRLSRLNGFTRSVKGRLPPLQSVETANQSVHKPLLKHDLVVLVSPSSESSLSCYQRLQLDVALLQIDVWDFSVKKVEGLVIFLSVSAFFRTHPWLDKYDRKITLICGNLQPHSIS